MQFLADQVLGLSIPSEEPAFVVSLVLHVTAALTCLVAGGLGHRQEATRLACPAGTIYCWSLAVVSVSTTVMAVTRWS